jgi:hypothetical protein
MKDSDRLLNKSQLAEALGVPKSYGSSMAAWGAPFRGNRIFLDDAKKWLRETPIFRPYTPPVQPPLVPIVTAANAAEKSEG